MVQGEKALRNHQFSYEDSTEIDIIINFLGKLEKMTLILSSETNTTMIDLAIIYNGLLMHLQNYEKNQYLGFLARDMKKQMIEVIFFFF